MIKLLKQYYLWIIAVIWVTLMLIPLGRPDPTKDMSLLAELVFKHFFPIFPAFVLTLLLAYEHGKGDRIWKYYSVKVWTRVGIVILVLFYSLEIYSVVFNKIIIWGTFTTAGFMIIVALLVANKLKYMGDVRAISFGLISTFGFVMIWELVYLTHMGIKFSDVHSFNDNMINILPTIGMVVPFIILLIFYSVKINFYTLICLIAGIILLFIWLYVLHGWVMVYWDGDWITKDNINWTAFIVTKASKIPFGIAVVTLVYKYNSLGRMIKNR